MVIVSNILSTCSEVAADRYLALALDESVAPVWSRGHILYWDSTLTEGVVLDYWGIRRVLLASRSSRQSIDDAGGLGPLCAAHIPTLSRGSPIPPIPQG